MAQDTFTTQSVALGNLMMRALSAAKQAIKDKCDSDAESKWRLSDFAGFETTDADIGQPFKGKIVLTFDFV